MKVVAFARAFLIVFKIESQPFFVFWWLVFWGVFNPTVHFLSDNLLSIGLLACVSAYPVFISFLLVKPSEVRLSRSFSETLCLDIMEFYQYLKQAGGLQTCTSAAFCSCCQVYPSV